MCLCMARFFPLRRGKRVNVLRLAGVISSQGRGTVLNDQAMAPLIEKAFSRGKPDAVALVVNSPGGSPVQSSLIGARIARLSKEKNVTVHAFVEDVAASGGYWLAVAADKIWVDPSSIVGSIGVISTSFGAQEFIARHGIERRVYTAGESKSMLDPFRSENPEDVARLKTMLDHIHTVFIDHVTTQRGAKLPEGENLFTGEIWVGQQAVDKGLADGIGHLVPKMKDLFGDKTRFQVFARRRGWMPMLGAQIVEQMGQTLDERTLYARYGL